MGMAQALVKGCPKITDQDDDHQTAEVNPSSEEFADCTWGDQTDRFAHDRQAREWATGRFHRRQNIGAAVLMPTAS